MSVNEYVTRRLAHSRLPYGLIAENARKRCHSRTTPASVRSIAAEMRRSGRRVLKRPRDRGH